MNEIWKPIDEYEGLYEVSTYGNIKSLRSGKMLRKRLTHRGYEMVNLSNDGVIKTFQVHRLVAKAFIPNRHNRAEINHIDFDSKNNHIDNLEWVHREENFAYSKANHQKALAKVKRTVKCLNDGTTYESIYRAAKALDCDTSSISKCCHGRISHTNGYSFAFADEGSCNNGENS